MTRLSHRSASASSDRSRWNLFLRALFWLTLLAVLTLATLPNPPQWPEEPSDKVQHFMAFLCLMLLGSAAYPRLSLVKLALGLALFGALIEAIQAVPALQRDADWLDWLVDVAAAAFVLLALLVWRKLRGKA
jgi:peptidoglycan/LPS O-acetylase OafA/YrhL